MTIAVDVLLPIPVPPLRYQAPLGAEAGIGRRIAVPWQGGVRLGVATAVEPVDEARALELREALDWVDERPFLLEETVDWLLHLARRHGAPAGVVLADLVPSGLREALAHEVRPVSGAELELPQRWSRADVLPADRLEAWREQGLVRERVRIARPTERRLVPLEAPDAALRGAAQDNQRAALERLRIDGCARSGAELARAAGVPESAVRALVRKGHAGYRELPAAVPEPPGAPEPRALPTGTPRAPDAREIVVTGGRRATRLASLAEPIGADVAAGGSVLVLAPERGLAEEAAALLAGAGLPVRCWTGRLDEDRRAVLWDALASGPSVLVGTYPSLAAPLCPLARVVVLEAGSDAYKLPSGARLVVPDAASRLAARRGAALALTDPLGGPEAWALAPGGERFELPRPRQRWHVADLRESRSWPLGSDLIRVLRQVAERKRQALLLASRRGFSAALGCRDCGALTMCPNCALPLRYHQGPRRLRCHQCGHQEAPPRSCPACGGFDLEAQRAAGSEWVAEAAAGVLGDYPIYRFDRDRRDDLAPLAAGEPGVLVGTSAALRLPPLPVLSLIGVVLVDGMLNLDDFRAEERTLRSLLALVELSGDRPPLTVVQSFQAEHALFETLIDEEPAALATYLEELDARRRRFGYPPYARLARVQLSGKARGRAWSAAEAAAARLRTAGAEEHELLGPAPAPVARVRGREVVQLLLRAGDDDRLTWLLDRLDARESGVQVRVDVDPRDVGALLD